MFRALSWLLIAAVVLLLTGSFLLARRLRRLDEEIAEIRHHATVEKFKLDSVARELRVHVDGETGRLLALQDALNKHAIAGAPKDD